MGFEKITTIIAKNIEKYLRESGMSRDDLVAHSFISRRDLDRVLDGEVFLSPRDIERIAKVFGKAKEDMIRNEDDNNA